jgi:hypothetical protein
VRAANAGARLSNSQSRPLEPRALEADELTILTGWAQALAEALAYAPERVEPLLADAHPCAARRAALRIAEPSAQPSEAIYCIGRTIRSVTSAQGVPTLDALQTLCREDGLPGAGFFKRSAQISKKTSGLIGDPDQSRVLF